MWFKDFPEDDPDANYPGPSAKQLIDAAEAERDLRRLKRSLEKLTVPQQREMIRRLSGRVFKDVAPASDAEASMIESKMPEHESEAQALTEASQEE